MQKCPNCGDSERQNKAGVTSTGSQRYRCMVCGKKYTPSPKSSGYDQAVRLEAVRLYLGGMTIRQAAETLGVNHQSVANWVRAYAAKHPELNLLNRRGTGELDRISRSRPDEKTRPR